MRSRLAPTALALWLAFPLVALARPGGGESYGGSSSSSSSSFGDSDDWDSGSSSGVHVSTGDDGMDTLLFFLAVAFLVGRAVYRARKEKAQRTGPAAAPSSRADPQLADGRFHARAAQLFDALNEAWFKRDLSPVRHRLSDATFQRFATQLRLLQLRGQRNATADNGLLELVALESERDDQFETVHAWLSARARDVKVPSGLDDAAARERAQEAPLERYVEVWTFLRRPGARPASLEDGACPSCGAPLVLGESAACAHCKAVVNSGQYDWVLAEITQASEAHPVAPQPGGFAALREADPALSRQVLEDRASLLFWKWVEALASGQAAPLAKVATPGFVDSLASRVAARTAMDGCAVGSVELLGAEADAEWHRVRLEVRWSSDGRLRRSVMELCRRADAKTPGAGLSTARCPGCAGPLTDNGQPSCDYCGEPLAASPRDWVLSSMEESTT